MAEIDYDDMCPNCVTPWKCNGPHESPAETTPEPREDVAEGKQSCGCWLSGGQVSVRQLGCAEHDTKGEDVAVAEVGLTDAEWTRLRHAAGNRGDLGPIAEEVERILGERVAKAWDEGHRAYRRLGPDGCKCGAYSEGECGCGKYGTNIITVNPYRADRRAER